ncbi:4-hydroxy-tetrahydrodipicolinate reductase [Halorubellus sp. JP-L1]|uniref:4-hydroxy-tetrahydrodipicolinate reductase n=1 Tax=Halorubellus sp. JP-L1 TaxID=2715753 RepID=UPI00140E7553|nr:4-hydroxy-tetrahydrodipicolinate reductase [Halorubellus sp. JP-L1]NHN42633.1 4-hydroxy-tetrahydrodipicolinate reductase [Halorubellus sp. JP-L1]
MRVAVTGATGRTGGEVLEAAVDRDVDVAFATARNPPASPIAGVDVAASDDFASLLATHEPNVVVDFTGPESTVEYAEACAAAGVAFVTGTTGLSDDQQAALDAAADEVPVLQAANFARGVQALLGVVGDAVAALPGYDVELVEAHHNGKRDAPSGTAVAMLDAVDAAREDHGIDAGAASGERVHGREGESRREPGEVGVHSLRAGDVPGEHELVIAGNHEELRLQHRATDRGVFAAGALDAAEWLSSRDAGWYEFADVVAVDDDRPGVGDPDDPADIVGTDGGQVPVDAGDEQ